MNTATAVQPRYERTEGPDGSWRIALAAPRLTAVGLGGKKRYMVVLMPGNGPMKTLAGREARAVLDVLETIYG